MTTIPAASSTTPSSSASSSTNSGANALAQFSSNFQSFLTLLTSQLQHQDPLNPMDSTQFTSQLVQFTGVEQGILQNQNLQQLIGLQSSSQMANASNYIGWEVNTNNGDKVQLTNGKGTINYNVTDTTTATVKVTITDSNGQVVKTLNETPTTTGAQSVKWDGTNSGGTTVSDGTYNVQIQAFNSQGASVPITTGQSGIVTSVNLVNGQVMLTTQGGEQIPVTDVTSLKNPNA